MEGSSASRHGTAIEPVLFCEDLAFPEGPIALADGSVIVVEIADGLVDRILPNGKKHVIAHVGGGPNGAAIGPDGGIYICNNGGFRWVRQPGHIRAYGQPDDYTGGRIERVNPSTGKVEVVYDSCDGRKLLGPNDIVFDAHGGFYFTDHGKIRDRDVDRGSVYYCKADGSLIKEVIHPISLPNGLTLSPDEQTLYVVETETARLWRYRIRAPGDLEIHPYPSQNGGAIVYGAGGFVRFDGVKAEADGRLSIATLQNGGITTVSPYDGFAEFISLPDRHTTNMSFGGEDMRTLFVTLSSTGRLVKLNWPRTGHKLNFVDRI